MKYTKEIGGNVVRISIPFPLKEIDDIAEFIHCEIEEYAAENIFPEIIVEEDFKGNSDIICEGNKNGTFVFLVKLPVLNSTADNVTGLRDTYNYWETEIEDWPITCEIKNKNTPYTKTIKLDLIHYITPYNQLAITAEWLTD